jgi:hypothetical protein
MQHPKLFLGVIGLTQGQTSRLKDFLSSNAAHAKQGLRADQTPDALHHPVWSLSSIEDADALMVAADTAHTDPDGSLRWPATAAQTRDTVLRLNDVSRPFVLLASPEQHPDIPAWQRLSTLSDDNALLQAIQRLETMLQPLRAIYALAHLLNERHHDFDEQHTMHLEQRGTLTTLVDFPQRRVYVRGDMRPADVEAADWCPRPRQANYVPQDFHAWHLEEVAWILSMHRTHHDLPERYARMPIYMRRLPRVRPSLLLPRHTVLLETLSASPMEMGQLQQIPELHQDWLLRDLYGLYMCRAITTQGVKAERMGSSVPFQPNSSRPFTSQQNTGLGTMPADL